MANRRILGRIREFQGEVHIRDEDGKLRQPTVNGVIYDGEVIVTKKGGRLHMVGQDMRDLDLCDGDIARVSADVASTSKAVAHDAAVHHASFKPKTARAKFKQDIEIDQTAAGNPAKPKPELEPIIDIEQTSAGAAPGFGGSNYGDFTPTKSILELIPPSFISSFYNLNNPPVSLNFVPTVATAITTLSPLELDNLTTTSEPGATSTTTSTTADPGATTTGVVTTTTGQVTITTTSDVSTTTTVQVTTSTTLPPQTTAPTSTEEPRTTAAATSTEAPRTTEQSYTTQAPITTEQPLTTVALFTTAQQYTTNPPLTTVTPYTTSQSATTIEVSTTVRLTTVEPTTTYLSTTPQPTTTFLVTTPEPTTTHLVTTTLQPTTTFLVTTPEPTTTHLVTTTLQPTTTFLVTTPEPTTTHLVTTTLQPTTTFLVTTPEPTTTHLVTTPEPTTTRIVITTPLPTTTLRVTTPEPTTTCLVTTTTSCAPTTTCLVTTTTTTTTCAPTTSCEPTTTCAVTTTTTCAPSTTPRDQNYPPPPPSLPPPEITTTCAPGTTPRGSQYLAPMLAGLMSEAANSAATGGATGATTEENLTAPKLSEMQHEIGNVIGIKAGNTNQRVTGHLNTEVAGEFGVLQMDEHGYYTYTINGEGNLTDQPIYDIFTYTMLGDDGKEETTSLTVTIMPDPRIETHYVVQGTSGNDVLQTDHQGFNLFIGGAGDDVMFSTASSVNTFKWYSEDISQEKVDHDVIYEFKLPPISDGTLLHLSQVNAFGDRLDLRDILPDFGNNPDKAKDLIDFVFFEKRGSDTVMHLDVGGHVMHTQDSLQVTFKDVDFSYEGNYSNQDIIEALINRGNLIID